MARQPTVWTFVAALLAVSFGLNWIWEVAQMFVYSIKPDEMRRHVLLYSLLATVVDALVTIAGYGVVMAFSRNLDWNLNSSWKPYLLMALFGAISAGLFEVVAKSFGLWTYKELMPLDPFIEVGLLPLLQLTLLMPAALAVVVWWHRQEA